MTDQEIYECLMEKKAILKQIAANTETQLRFIRKLELRGLRRVIQEREKLISDLAAVSACLANEPGWESKQAMQFLVQAIAESYQNIMEVSRAALAAGMTERDKLKSKLQRMRTVRSGKNRYADTGVRAYCRINVKG